jgi:hypothetical protein
LTNEFTVETLCLVLGVSRTAYYRYQRGQTYQLTPKKEANKALVERVFLEHKRRYGSRRIVSQLQDEGHQLSRQQVRMLMKVADRRVISRICSQSFNHFQKGVRTGWLQRDKVHIGQVFKQPVSLWV